MPEQINQQFVRNLHTQIKAMYAEVKGEVDRITNNKPFPNGTGYLVGAKASLRLTQKYLDDLIGTFGNCDG